MKLDWIGGYGKSASLPSLLTYFDRLPEEGAIPACFPSPFAAIPHPLAIRAAEIVRQDLQDASPNGHDFFQPGQGKMMGVLVVRDLAGEIGFLRSVSGMLGRCWQVPGFVPPLFDLQDRERFWPAGQVRLDVLGKKQAALQQGEIAEAKEALRELDLRHQDAALVLAQEHALRKAQRARDRLGCENTSESVALLRDLSGQSQADRKEGKRLRALHREQREKFVEVLQALEERRVAIKRERTAVSNGLLQQIQAGYRLVSAEGESRSLESFFAPEIPPGGSGDCAAPKLLGYANQKKLHPLALAEFWWGLSPSGSVRHHEYFYPPCRSRCQPILPFLLQGLAVEPAPVYGSEATDAQEPSVVYEDAFLVVVHKPSGLLSVPGASPLLQDCALSRMQARAPGEEERWPIHRLDLDTSGLLMLAKTLDVYKSMQRQFAEGKIEKEYLAWLEGTGLPESGEIDLPLRVDLLDRPRQIVDFEHGKSSETHFRVLERRNQATKVAFVPRTGRTHQLRVHASHSKGLGMPILGDRLYGRPGGRLRLHAHRLRFAHPVTKEGMDLQCVPPEDFDLPVDGEG